MNNEIIAILVDNRWGTVVAIPCGTKYIKAIFAKDKRNRKFSLLGVITVKDCETLFYVVPKQLTEWTYTVAQTRALLLTL